MKKNNKMLKCTIFSFIVLCFCMVFVNTAGAVSYVSHDCGIDPVVLNNSPNYFWWYGCSPTSAGMMMGYYDRNGYDSKTYDNIVPGGVAELFPTMLTNTVIASYGHWLDFYQGGDYASGDDYVLTGGVPSGRPFDCLADFMGTSQDSNGNINGGTTFWYRDDGLRLTAEEAFFNPAINHNDSGMFGIGEYLWYRGYNFESLSLYNQYTDNDFFNEGFSGGFTYDNYKAEIDAGRSLLIQVEGHTMFGFGYDNDSETVYFHDTWTPVMQSMTWGGSYAGLNMYGVTCLTPAGGAPIPEPSTLLLFLIGGLGLLGIKRKIS